MMTNPGIPLIYYGDEVGLAGGGDPDNRRMMPWEDSMLNEHQRALQSMVQRLGTIRSENPVLARGRRLSLSSSQNTWVYRMVGCGAGSPDVTVAINRADNTRQKNITFDMEQAKRVRNALSVLLLRLVDKESNQPTTSIQMDGGDFQ